MLEARLPSIVTPLLARARIQPFSLAPSPPPGSTRWESRFHSTVLSRTTMSRVSATEIMLWCAP